MLRRPSFILSNKNNRKKSDGSGHVKLKYFDPLVILPEILGRSIVIHNGVDDLGLGNNTESLKTGNAGKKLTCAVIGITKSK